MKTTITVGLGAAVAVGTALGCAALIGLDPANQQPACLDTADQTALGAQQDFAGTLVSCSVLNQSDQNAVSACIHTKMGISQQCANCVALGGTCSMQSCLPKCTGGAITSDCKTCVATACNPTLIACGGMPVYACLDQADQMAVAKHANTIEMELKGCAAMYMGNSAGVIDCIQQTAGLSQACATCYAEEGLCALSQCPMCVDNPMDTSCLNCVGMSCGPVFALCSGPLDGGGPG
jgi:hypothetical protein